MQAIYLDYNATTPIAKEVADEMKPYLYDYFGNPSSSHIYGRACKKAVDKGRKQLAALLNCDVSEVIFTSGGTESNNYAIKGYAFANKSKGNHIITTSIEHPAVSEVCKYLESEGFEVTYLPVDGTGRVQVADVEAAIRPETILISVMYANNEVGTLQPISEISELAKKHGIAVHSDCSQAVGKVPVDIQKMGVDLLTVAGHKFYGPKGIGALYIGKGIKLQKLIHGADHENNLRAGTENVLEIVGLGRAAKLAKANLETSFVHDKSLVNRLKEALSILDDIQFNGNKDFCLPNTLSVSFKNIEANTLLANLPHVAASAGAACHTDSISVSATLAAMNLDKAYAMGTIRFSVGKYNTEDEIDQAAEAIIEAVNKLRV
ncbi:cysteine desulfurase family protein [Ancylomarina sp. 16SWW S1-10-2]|uniref:cysteine desulfurase family protein n=1 Tax=Ancylomarina sp. 16SWW S1-10-2 TaxID=2499681 RepID=UPI0012AD63EF|nr:cysteine desulfurase family protein [Ancylomarina sp. 16SWW S1-10-2]MRT93296.1 cysteine desulfurase [Ancylomarina sp. 16SWW S1-10-2]